MKLQKDNLVMEVASELQALVFERNGYVRVDKEMPMKKVMLAEPVKKEVQEEVNDDPVEEPADEPAQTKRRGRRPKKQ